MPPAETQACDTSTNYVWQLPCNPSMFSRQYHLCHFNSHLSKLFLKPSKGKYGKAPQK